MATRTELVAGIIEPGGGVDWGGEPAPPPTRGTYVPPAVLHGYTKKKTSPQHTRDDSAGLRATVDATASTVDTLFTMLQDSIRVQNAQQAQVLHWQVEGKKGGKKAPQTATIAKTKRKKTAKTKLRASANHEADVDATSNTPNSNITAIGTWAMVLFVTEN